MNKRAAYITAVITVACVLVFANATMRATAVSGAYPEATASTQVVVIGKTPAPTAVPTADLRTATPTVEPYPVPYPTEIIPPYPDPYYQPIGQWISVYLPLVLRSYGR